MSVKIICIGDSITYGFPYGPKASWVSLVAAATGLNLVNCGQNGDTTRFMAYRFKNDVLNQNPSHIIIMGGTNDAYVGEPLEVIKDNIQTMARKAAAREIVPILALPIPAGEEPIETNLITYREWMRQYASENNLTVIDFGPAMSYPSSGTIIKELYMDDVHPSVDGYDVMAEVVKKTIEKLFQ